MWSFTDETNIVNNVYIHMFFMKTMSSVHLSLCVPHTGNRVSQPEAEVSSKQNAGESLQSNFISTSLHHLSSAPCVKQSECESGGRRSNKQDQDLQPLFSNAQGLNESFVAGGRCSQVEGGIGQSASVVNQRCSCQPSPRGTGQGWII